MAELILESSARVTTRRGLSYRVWVMGEETLDGSWYGWLEFCPVAGGPILTTGRETSQSSRAALHYWATGLEPVYFEGAIGRVSPLPTQNATRANAR